MFCSKCGSQNKEGSSFCVKCGNNLKVQSEDTTEAETSKEIPSITTNSVVDDIKENAVAKDTNPFAKMETTPVASTPAPTPTPSAQAAPAVSATSTAGLNYISFMISSLLRPSKTFKDEEEKLSGAKNSIILASISAGLMFVIHILSVMLSVIVQKGYSIEAGKVKTTIDFSNLSNIDYLPLIGKSLLITVGVVAGIALIYYIVSLLFKKDTNYFKILSITAVSFLPYALLYMGIAPILGKIWLPIYVVLGVIGIVYSIVIFMSLINQAVTFDNPDMKIYFNAICVIIVAVIGYYSMTAYINSITNVDSILNSLDSYID